MTSSSFAADWDLIYRWEWFRRARWRQGFRAAVHGQGGGPARAFSDLARVVGAKLLLDASCGLGRRAVCLAEGGLHVVGSDVSGLAVSYARELAREEGVPVSFFRSPWSELPQNMPHHFDGVLVTGLGLEPSWDRLGMSLVGLFHALRPGGFLMFVGAAEGEAEAEQRARMDREWAAAPPERAEWFHREGAVSCVLVRLRARAADYIDDRLLFASEENGETRLETTVLRRPGYWTWRHWRDVTRMAGFCHLETRDYPGYGLDGGMLRINVAWKEKSADAEAAADADRELPYRE